MICQEFAELSGAYVLGAITPEERREAEKHLAHCFQCRCLWQDLQSVTELLPLSSPTITPPPQLKARVLSAIAAEKFRQTSISQPPRSTWWQHRTLLLIATTLILVLLLGGMIPWNISLQQQITNLTTHTVKSYTLQGTASTGNATGELISIPAQHLTILVMHGLSQPTNNYVYQGWLVQGTQTISIGLLKIQDDVAIVDSSENIKGYTTAAVSLEPGPEASQGKPRGPIVAAGSLNR